jgi:transcriptional regulator with XRE-family HTH domain
MSFAKSLGEALKLLRSRRGWPQKQLAAAAGITKGMVSSYEHGKQKPTLGTLAKILTALEADLCDLHWAVEFVNGTQRPAHALSAHFQLGQARSLRAAARRLPDPAAAGAGHSAPGGETQSEPRLPEAIETALGDTMAGVQKLLRYALQGAK